MLLPPASVSRNRGFAPHGKPRPESRVRSCIAQRPADEGGMDFSANWLMTSMLVGTIGGGLFLYGKKQARLPQLLTGLAMFAESAFVPSIPWMIISALATVFVCIGVVRAGA